VARSIQNWVIPWFRWIGNEIEEWDFAGVSFDGIDPAICQLIEAKGKYGFAFENPDGSEPIPKPWAGRSVIPELHAEFSRQYYALTPYQPNVSLLWVIHTWVLWLHMSRHINTFGSLAAAEHRPFPGWSPDD
jgi:Restriction endonuclease fold toxin 5